MQVLFDGFIVCVVRLKMNVNCCCLQVSGSVEVPVGTNEFQVPLLIAAHKCGTIHRNE